MADRIQLRRDTAANWTAYNPILLEGEPGIEIDTDQWKLGDGVHTWSQLAYRGGECVQQRGQSTTVAMSQKAVTDELNLIGVFDISAHNLTDGQPTKYADLTAALGTNGANVPEQYRVPGMTIRYVQSSDNKYMQCRLMATSFSIDEADWQCIDEQPTPYSDNFVKSGGINQAIANNSVINNIISWYGPGYSVNVSTGSIAYLDGQARNVSELLKISYADNIIFNRVSNKFYICYYAQDKSFISADGWKGGVYYDFSSAPDNAEYFRIMIDTSVNSVSDISCGKISNTLSQIIEDSRNIRAATFGSQIKIIWKSDKVSINFNNGAYMYSNNRCASERCLLQDIPVISFTGNTAGYYIAYYDVNDDYISYVGKNTALSYDFGDAPSNAVYCRIVIDTTVCQTFEVIPFSTSCKESINEINDILYGKELNLTWLADTGVLVNNGTIVTPSPNRSTTEPIQLSKIEKIHFTGSSAKYYAIYYSGASADNSNYVSSDGWIYDLNYDFTNAPATATYVRIMLDTAVCSSNDVVPTPDAGLIQAVENLKNENGYFKNIIIVAQDGSGDYITIEDALANAGDSNSKHVTIFVKPGIYYPAPKTSPTLPYIEKNRNLSLIGLDRDACILKGDVGYYDIRATPVIDYALLRLNGNVLVKNFTFINTCERYTEVATEQGWDLTNPHARAYCFHADSNREAGDITTIENCKMYNDHFSCIGFGLRKDSTLRIKDCELESDVTQATDIISDFSSYGTLYGHLAANDVTATNQRLEVINCLIRNKNHNRGVDMKLGVSTEDYSNISSKLLLSHNTVRTINQQYAFVNIKVSGQPQINEIDDMSFGNNVESMNYSD